MITMAGMIGVGKTTYTQHMANMFQAEPLFEEVSENPILDAYYSEPTKYAFSLQIYFLNQRVKSIKRGMKFDRAILDRSIYEDALFTQVNNINGNISDVEWQLYQDLLANMMDDVRIISESTNQSPELLVYLHAPFDLVLEKIKRRGRPYEQVEGRPDLLAYYKQLHTLYGEWYANYDHSAKMAIDVSKFDILTNTDQEIVAKKIQDKWSTLLVDSQI